MMSTLLRNLPLFFAASFLVPMAANAQASASDCAIPVPDGETLGDTFSCGRIEVPENWGLPDGRTIPISYTIMKSDSLAPFEDPVIYFQGGPGGSALNSSGASFIIISGSRRARCSGLRLCR